MKFYAFCTDKTLADCNGGSLVLWHHIHALEELGHSGEMLNLIDDIPEDADFVMFQSEWYNVIGKALERSKAKRICWLGHYKTGTRYQMPNIADIKADYFHTQYKGDCVKWGEKQIGKKIYYLPHAGCSKCNVEGQKIDVPEVLFIGNHFPERQENWLNEADVTKVQSPFPEVKNYYKSAIVCPNIHGDWQKGKESEFFTVAGEMINERIFQIILSGGFAISDDTPIVGDFFNTDEIPQAESKEGFKALIDHFKQNPEQRNGYMEKAKARIFKEHLYTHRWKEYLKVITQ